MIDLLDPELHGRGDELAVCRDLRRAHGPVVRSPGRRGPGYWSVLGHPELVEVLRDPATFTSFSGTRPEVIRPERAIRPLHNLDPPAHGPLRTIAGCAIHATRLTQLDPIIDAAVARALRDGDIVPAFEHEIAGVFATWLGFRVSPDELFARVNGVHGAGAALLDTARTDPAWPERAADARRATEAIAALMNAEIENAREGTVLHELRAGAPDAARMLGALLVEAGLPTSNDAIGSAIVDLARAPAVLADPDWTTTLVEELLRRASPITQFARRATRDVELAGARIRAGEQVVVWMVAANHDERVFADPESLDPGRSPNPHVAFGAGPHRCLGAILGRRILRALVLELRRRPVTLTAEPIRRASSYMRGYAHVTVAMA